MEAIPVLEALHELEMGGGAPVFFADERGQLREFASRDLVQQGRRLAGNLLRRGVRAGEPVILVMTEPQSAITAILGCMIAGCPPTPIYPPQNLAAVPRFLSFVKHVTERSGATYILADDRPYSVVSAAARSARGIRGVARVASLLTDPADGPEFSGKSENPIAFLQFTSGSTSTPKGVMVTHASLAANLAMIRKASHMDRNSCVVTWLPVYHDMGLIGTVLNALTLPCKLVVLPPISFLRHPRLWLELISSFRGTHTAAPNFAYGLCARRIHKLDGVDLGSMTTFICGAEPVIPKTMEDFVSHFRDAGLAPGALVPAYGLAEATLAVTFSPHLRGLKTESIDLDSLTDQHIARLSTSNSKVHRISSCGIALDGLEIRIASDSSAATAERSVGEIQVRGASVAGGYIGDPEATASSRTSDGWLRTGDLGYLADGELYPCGRIKEIVIIRGKKYHAHDLESMASQVHGIRTGNVVAFSQHSAHGEMLIIVAETRGKTDTDKLAHAVSSQIATAAGISPDDVVIVPSGTLPKTSSGKLKRIETRERYEQGRLFAKPSRLSVYLALLKSRLNW
jgi:acyl-CoA synthetase (AMP-forming)/AMP-acid ligase II